MLLQFAYWLRHDGDQHRDAHREPSIWRIAPRTGVQMEPAYHLQRRAGSSRMLLLVGVEADGDQEGRRSEWLDHLILLRKLCMVP